MARVAKKNATTGLSTALATTKNRMVVDPAVLETAHKIRQIGENARQVFIDRDDVIHALECALCSGEHMIMLGKPGTGKSALARYFAENMGLNFFRTVLNPDTVREDLFGPISAKALSEDRWERKWSALATADIALTDEIGKASSQVQNMLLDAMEERKARSADIEINLPLHMLVAGTNETLDDDSQAVWDRFTIRVIVRYISSAQEFSKLLGVDTEQREVIPVDRDELIQLRYTAHQMSLRLSPEVKKTVIEVWSEISNQIPTPISDRRWKRWLKVAAGRALWDGRMEILESDLIVGKWILWEDIDHEKQIHSWLQEKVNRDQQEYLDALKLTEEFEQVVAVHGSNLSRTQSVEILYNTTKFSRELMKKANLGDKRWQNLYERVVAVRDFLSE